MTLLACQVREPNDHFVTRFQGLNFLLPVLLPAESDGGFLRFLGHFLQAHNLKVVGSNPTPATKITIYQYVTTFQVFWLARFFALGILPFVTHFVTCRQVFLGFCQAHFLKALSANPAPATSKYYFTSAYKPHQI